MRQPSCAARRISGDLLDQLNAIPAAQLSPDEQVNAAVFRTILENAIADARFRKWEMPFNSDSSFWTYLDARDPFDDAAEYRRYIARMRDIPRYFDEQIVNMRAGLKRGFTRAARDARRARRIDRRLHRRRRREEQPSTSRSKRCRRPFRRPSSRRFEPRARRQSSDAVLPAYRKLLGFYRDEYLPKARKSIAARDLPDGDAFYRAQIREYTTTDMTPEEIHQLGLKEVARIDAEMRKTMRDSGFKGTFAGVPQLPEDRPAILRQDSRRAAGRLGLCRQARRREASANYFGLLPRRRFTIIPVPDALAPFYTAGRGGLEKLPDEHLQSADPAALQHPGADPARMRAGAQLPGGAVARSRRRCRASAATSISRAMARAGACTANGSATRWASTARLMRRSAQLSYEMWRAARLVIDTGIHRYGWSRQQAIDYLAGHTALSQHEVETEVDRYISWPGQALSYKLGELTIRKLRAEAETELGHEFDQRGFHDRILALGSVPLSVLEQQMRAFIRETEGEDGKG